MFQMFPTQVGPRSFSGRFKSILMVGAVVMACQSMDFSCRSVGAQEPSLRELAEKRNLYIGMAAGSGFWTEAEPYREVLAREFNALVAENVMKASALQPQRGQYNFTRADELVEFAQAHRMRLRGHTLLWHRMQPRWLERGEFTREELIEVMRDHIHTVVGRYKGKIAEWDVVNEAIDDGGGLRKSFWLETIGEDYIDLAFKFAHEADPEALLFYNDYGAEGMGRKSSEVYELAKGLKERGSPIHGVGLQCHLRSMHDRENIRQNIARLAALGLKVGITEVDFALKLPASPEDHERQAGYYRELLELTMEFPEACEMFMIWGLTDRHSWIPGESRGYGDPLIYDGEYKPKPAYFQLRESLEAGRGE